MQAALAKYGLSEADLRQDLLWQVAVLRFTETRFPPAEPGEPGGSANRAAEPGAAAAEEDRQLDDWLKQTRASTHIEFKPEAFQ